MKKRYDDECNQQTQLGVHISSFGLRVQLMIYVAWWYYSKREEQKNKDTSDNKYHFIIIFNGTDYKVILNDFDESVF